MGGEQTGPRSTAGAFHEYITVGPVFRLNTDSSPANLQPGEVPQLDNFFERSGKTWPWFKTTVDLIPGADHDAICNTFALNFPASLVATVTVDMVFTTNNLYHNIGGGLNLAAPAGGSTAISTDAGGVGDKFSISVVNNIVYFSHNGKGPLRKWDPTAPATYADVAAPGTGWHTGVKLKPVYLTAITNQLICVGDTSAPGSPYDVAWSNPGLPEDFTPFGGGHILLADTPDPITACSTIFGKLIIYKSDCIIIGVVQTDALNPFFFERYQQGAEASEGCVAAYTLAGNGFTDYLLSRTGVKSFDGSTLQPIGQGIDHGLFSEVLGHSFPPTMCGALGAFHLTSLDTSGTLAYAIGFYNAANGSNRAYIYNTKSGSWSRGLNLSGSSTNRTGGVLASIGSLWYNFNRVLCFGGQGLGATENVLNLPTIDDTNTNIFPANLTNPEAPTIMLAPSIYGQPQNQKTIYRLGVAFDPPAVSSQSAVGPQQNFNGFIFVNTTGDVGNGQNTVQMYPYLSPTFINPSNSQFSWLETVVTDRLPSIVLRLMPQANTATSFAAIDNMTVEFSRGGDR